ncbi:hypothetical protein ONE63_010717 [Megalurothrips usitatus]|uniref:E3 ubiquitin-protein ligase Topors n=1 Tax=Megalurothrips usitatus TaxID=439358 RepID=A0AAV7XHH0_9NEOP|nr:hypothetical protein ONE63_010717 [Megalurothrips usitatus]
MMEESTCPPTPPLSKCPDTPPRPGTSKTTPSKWDSPDRKDKSRSPTPNRPTSPENCAICLGPLTNKSFTNSCCHQFCFVCLLEWSKVKAECPLCKVAFDSIIHNVRSQDDYDQYHVVRALQFHPTARASDHSMQAFSEWMVDRGLARFRAGAEGFATGFPYEAIPSGPPSRITRGNPNGTSAFRRSIYDRDLWARAQPDLSGRYRDCSPEFYRQNPAQMHRLLPFLNRELNVLLDGGARTMYIIEKIFDLLPQYSMTSTMFRSQIARLIGYRHAPHFCHELRMFASSPYDLVGYDRNVQYHPNGGAGLSIELESSDNSDPDDDDDDIQEPWVAPVIFIRFTIQLWYALQNLLSNGMPNLHSHYLKNSFFFFPLLFQVNVSSDSESDNTGDVQVVGVVKPRHERTPEIITLSSPEHPSRSSPRTVPSRETSRLAHSPSDLICINLGSSATAQHTWHDGLDDVSSDDSTVRTLRRRNRKSVSFNNSFTVLSKLNLREASTSSSSSSSSDVGRQRKRHKHRSSNKSKSRKHSHDKKSRNEIASDSEDETQPSTSSGKPKRRHKVDNHSSSSRRSKYSKRKFSPLRDAAISDSGDLSPPRIKIRSAIVQQGYTQRLSSSEDEPALSHTSRTKLSSFVGMRCSDEGNGSWKADESNSSTDSPPDGSDRESKRKRKDSSKKSRNLQNSKKRRDRSRSPGTHSKRSKKNLRPLSDSDEQYTVSSKKKQKAIGYSESD